MGAATIGPDTKPGGTSGEMMGNGTEHAGKMLGKCWEWLENGGKMLGKCWEIAGNGWKMVGKCWKLDGCQGKLRKCPAF